jgi:hypothetical protein
MSREITIFFNIHKVVDDSDSGLETIFNWEII